MGSAAGKARSPLRSYTKPGSTPPSSHTPPPTPTPTTTLPSQFSHTAHPPEPNPVLSNAAQNYTQYRSITRPKRPFMPNPYSAGPVPSQQTHPVASDVDPNIHFPEATLHNAGAEDPYLLERKALFEKVQRPEASLSHTPPSSDLCLFVV